jgi:hypothetical protein
LVFVRLLRAFYLAYRGFPEFVPQVVRQLAEKDLPLAPSIGIILCKTKNHVVAEYALRDLKKPTGVSGYVSQRLYTGV